MPAWPVYGARVPLWDAVYAQDAALAQKLLAGPAGAAQVNTAHGLQMQTSVHLAVRKGNAKLLKALLFSGGDANARTIDGTTPLHLAVQQRRKDMVQDLLLVGANPGLRNFTDMTAIDMARQLRLGDLVGLLEQAATSLGAQRELKRQQDAQARAPSSGA